MSQLSKLINSVLGKTRLKTHLIEDTESGVSSVSAIKSVKGSRLPGESYYVYILTLLLGYWAADLTILSLRDRFLPKSAPPVRRPQISLNPPKMRSDYGHIVTRNIFNSDGRIPDPLSKDKSLPGTEELGPALPSNLPLALLGTIVHLNKAKSVATIEIKSGTSRIFPYFPNDEIDSMATLLKVERKRALLRNSQSGRIEYIEIKEDTPISFGLKVPKSGEASSSGSSNFTVSRTELNEYMKDLPNLLQSATAVPYILPGGGSKVEGYKVIDIQPTSPFAKFGIQRDDIIRSVNNELIDSPAKAMELYNKLRNDTGIQLEIVRGGRVLNNSYTIQ